MEHDRWASDAPISAPKPNDRLPEVVTVDLGGMIFTPNGIALPVTTPLHEQRYTPDWAPQQRESEEAPRGRTS